MDGERFFDREAELESLSDRIKEGTHTLLTAQRRMGKTSLVRELLRRLREEDNCEVLFVDLEGSEDAADAVAEIAIQARSIESAWNRISAGFANVFQGIGDRIETVGLADLTIRLRAGINTGSWRTQGDQVFSALADGKKRVVLAIDELPILINRLLKGYDDRITSEGRKAADQFLSWLRKNGQDHRDKVSLIISGSIGLEPVLKQAGLSAHANIFSPLELKPWCQETAVNCLAALARNYKLNLSREVRVEMCRRLRCCVPHHVQQFFAHLHEHVRGENKCNATLKDVEIVYKRDLLSVRGQIDLDHYESRLKMVLGTQGYEVALSLLTEAAINKGLLTWESSEKYRTALSFSSDEESVSLGDVLEVLRHDGYLVDGPEGFRFVSGWLEDWWEARHGTYFVPIAKR